MTRDTYGSFEELKRHEKMNIDYRIWVRDMGSPITIAAPHGGGIEPGTSLIAKAIAANRYNCYCFEGIKRRGNGHLHITSHLFDEPVALELLSRSRVVVAIHACTGTKGLVYIGGLDARLKDAVADALEGRGIRVSRVPRKFRGVNPGNICNRGATKKGVQLEITRDLRDDPEKMRIISGAARFVLDKLYGRN